ncbi:MAG: DUF4331 domain-containing protein, partial [Thermoanaerobaculia bacterium]|nr:DUF4331 domain-containing protein [Thermoanaerobaculia bacterium]
MLLLVGVLSAGTAWSSSHREAPFITEMPKVDATDFYMFRSYESGRSNHVTIIANYIPLQHPYGGPNYFTFDPDALYEIHIDNGGQPDGGADSVEDLTFQFRFTNPLAGVSLNIRDSGVAIPLRYAGSIVGADGGINTGVINLSEQYSVNLVRGNRRTGTSSAVTSTTGTSTFIKPVDNAGIKTFGANANDAGYDQYARQYIYDITIPGCSGAVTTGKVFVGQRAESFAVNLGTVFDLVNAPLAVIIDPANRAAVPSPIAGMNVTSIALEIPIACLAGTAGGGAVLGGWTTASVRQARVINPDPTYTVPSREGGAWAQVSRLSNPLVNELVIGLPDKDKFNASEPRNDGTNFATYVVKPTLPILLELVLGGALVGNIPNVDRADLVAAFLTGVTQSLPDGG